jgi:hypothetical protein
LPEEIAKNITIQQLAVAERSGRVAFAALGSVRSAVVEGGEKTVPATAIGELDMVPTLIKMDVEGFELPALKGASRVLRNNRPVLAISLYHHASDLWTIPNFLKALVPEYSLHLRRYAEDCWELVLYAIPLSRLVGTSSKLASEQVSL